MTQAPDTTEKMAGLGPADLADMLAFLAEAGEDMALTQAPRSWLAETVAPARDARRAQAPIEPRPVPAQVPAQVPATGAVDLAEVLETAEIKALRAGEAIFKEGEEGNDVYVIRSGSVVVEKSIGGTWPPLSRRPSIPECTARVSRWESWRIMRRVERRVRN